MKRMAYYTIPCVAFLVPTVIFASDGFFIGIGSIFLFRLVLLVSLWNSVCFDQGKINV